MKTKEENFRALVERFGKAPGSHLFPLFNYFFIPQTKAQFIRWKKECEKGMYNQNLLYSDSCEQDFELIKAFCPNVEKKYTKSKTMIRVVNFDRLIESVWKQINK